MFMSADTAIMRTLLTYLIDTLFPPSRETLLVRRLTSDDVMCLYAPRSENEVTALTSFSSPVIRALIHETKFKGNTRGAELLAYLLTTYIESHDALLDATYIPIPLSKERLRERGYNQVARILKAVRKMKPSVIINDTLLERSRHTRPQTELTREERLTNLSGAFLVTKSDAVSGKTIVLVDDVTTTGATLKEAEKALLPYQPRAVILIAIAH